jgi:hypothetical protein
MQKLCIFVRRLYFSVKDRDDSAEIRRRCGRDERQTGGCVSFRCTYVRTKICSEGHGGRARRSGRGGDSWRRGPVVDVMLMAARGRARRQKKNARVPGCRTRAHSLTLDRSAFSLSPIPPWPSTLISLSIVGGRVKSRDKDRPRALTSLPRLDKALTLGAPIRSGGELLTHFTPCSVVAELSSSSIRCCRSSIPWTNE